MGRGVPQPPWVGRRDQTGTLEVLAFPATLDVDPLKSTKECVSQPMAKLRRKLGVRATQASPSLPRLGLGLGKGSLRQLGPCPRPQWLLGKCLDLSTDRVNEGGKGPGGHSRASLPTVGENETLGREHPDRDI